MKGPDLMRKKSLLGAALVLAACAEPAVDDIRFDIAFEALVDGVEFVCGEAYAGVGATGASMSPQGLGFYVSDVALVSRDGAETPFRLIADQAWQTERVALLDFDDATGGCNGTAAMNDTLRGRAPPGDYAGLSFTLGVPEDLNHADATLAPAPLNYTSLFWGWRGGYIFFRLDMDTTPTEERRADSDATGFSVHVGSVGCGDPTDFMLPPERPCAQPNRARIMLRDFDPAQNRVALDLAALLRDTDITINAPDTESGCMASLNDADCTPLLSHFGLPYGGGAEPRQSVFSVR